MTRMRDPVSPRFRLETELMDLFGGRTGAGFPPPVDERDWPEINVWEGGNDAWVEAELPGLSLENLDISISGKELTVSGERKPRDPDGGRWIRRERPEGRFSRMVTLPWDTDADKVEASLHAGVLTIRLPKAEHCRPRKVPVLGS